jgi:hypothetical protein
VTAFVPQPGTSNPQAAPSVTSVSVAATSANVTINGTNLSNVLLVQVGGLSAPVQSVSATSITVRVRPMPAGKYDTLIYFKDGSTLRVANSVTISGTVFKPVTTVSTLNIVGFARGSSIVPAAQLNRVVQAIKRMGGSVSVECIGSTEGPTVLRVDARLAMQRAKVVCDALKRSGVKVTSVSYINQVKSGSAFRSVSIRVER